MDQRLALALALSIASTARAAAPAASEPPPPFALVQTIPLPGVTGRCDHMTVDLRGGRLFVAALENRSVEVVDFHEGRRVLSLERVGEPQGVAFLPWSRRLVVGDGSGGMVYVFDDTLARLPAVPLWGDADNIHLDSLAHRAYVAYGEGGLVALDPQARRVVATFELGGHPEGFALEHAGARIFASQPDHSRIVVFDRRKGRVVARWPLEPGSANFPVALDEPGHRLFVGCRRPMVVRAIDTRTGARIAELAIAADVDDLFWDGPRRRLYASCGEGAVEVFEGDSGGALVRRGRIATRTGARTSLYVPELGWLFVAVPANEAATAEIRVYAARP